MTGNIETQQEIEARERQNAERVARIQRRQQAAQQQNEMLGGQAANVPPPPPGDANLSAAAITAPVEAAVTAAVTQVMNAMTAQSTTTGNVPVAPSPLALAPGGTGGSASAPWDFTKGDGLKFYISSVQALDSDKRYGGEQEGLYHFLDEIYDRADTFGWLPILSVIDSKGELRLITKQFGILEHAQVVTHAQTYLGTNTRNSQASACLRKLIKNSITPSLWDEVRLKHDQFTLPIVPYGMTDAVPTEDGVLMLFELTNIVAIKTRSTVSSLLKKLNDLEAIMEESKSDIQVFNKTVNLTLLGLRAHRTKIPNILPALFEGYKNCSDTRFVEYISRKEEEYEDGTRDMDDKELMKLALDKYKVMTEKKEWMQKSERDLEFLAMRAELEETKKCLTQKQPTRRSKNDSDTCLTPWPNDGKFAWKGVAPKSGEAQEKIVKGRTYVHCPHHGATKWVLKQKKGVVHLESCKAAARKISEADGDKAKHLALIGTATPKDDEDDSTTDGNTTVGGADDPMVAKTLAMMIKIANKA